MSDLPKPKNKSIFDTVPATKPGTSTPKSKSIFDVPAGTKTSAAKPAAKPSVDFGTTVATAKLKGAIAKSNTYNDLNKSIPTPAQTGVVKVLGAASNAAKFATGNGGASLADKIAAASDLQKISDQKQAAVATAMKGYMDRFNETARPGETPAKEAVRRMQLLAEQDANGRGQEPAILKTADKAIGRTTGSVLDVLSRGQYVSANVVGAAVKGVKKNPFNALALLSGPGGIAGMDNSTKKAMAKGAAQGITGKVKGSYYKVLEDAGVHNKIILAIGGTLGDVFLDPSTYLTGGMAKAATEADKSALMAKNIASAVADHEAKAVTAQYVNKYGKTLKQGGKAWKAAEQTAKETAIKAGEEAGLKAVAALRPGAVTLKFGKTPIFSSEKVYALGKAVMDKTSSSGFGQLVERGFSTNYVDAGNRMVKDLGLNADRRMILNGGMHGLKENEANMRNIFAVLTPEEKKMITIYRDKGIPQAVSHVPLKNDPTRSLGEFFTHAETYFRDAFQAQNKAGVLRRNVEDYLPNYVPLYAEKGLDEQAKLLKRERTSIKKQAKSAMGKGQVLNNPKALDNPDIIKNFAPTTQIDNVIAKHMQEAYHKTAWTEFFSDALDKYGAKIADPAAQKAALGQGLVPVEKGSDYFVHSSVKDVLDGINATRKNVKASSHVADQLAQIQSLWKFGKTGMNPGHHVMNMIGDSTTAMIDGANPLHIMEGIGMTTGNKSVLDKAVNIVAENGTKYSMKNSDILDAYRTSGADAGYHIIQTTEDALANNMSGRMLNSGLAQGIRGFSEGREASVRIGHFKSALIDELKQGKKMKDAIHSAANRVLKFEKDYSSLTAFEKKLRKGPIPFYTWLRKNTPLMFEMMITRPGKAIAPLKLQNNAVEAITGERPESPYELIKAPWQELMPAIFGDKSTMSNMLVDNGLPIQDGVNMAQHISDGNYKAITNDLMSSLSPGISLPVNMLTDASTKPYKQKAAQELAGLLPYGPLAYKMLDKSKDKATGEANVTDRERMLAFVQLFTGLRSYESQASDKLKIVNRSNSAQMKEIKSKLGAKK